MHNHQLPQIQEQYMALKFRQLNATTAERMHCLREVETWAATWGAEMIAHMDFLIHENKRLSETPDQSTRERLEELILEMSACLGINVGLIAIA